MDFTTRSTASACQAILAAKSEAGMPAVISAVLFPACQSPAMVLATPLYGP
jgi:hypothetical protein